MILKIQTHDQDPEWKIPENWTWIRLEEIASSIKPGFPSGKHNREKKGVPHMRPMNINTKGEIDLSDVKFVQPEAYDSLMKGDVLFNNTNSPDLLGKTACIKQDTNWAYSNHMTRIRFDTSFISPEWISYALHNLFFRGFFKMNCRHHVNQASINSSYLAMRTDIPLAPHEEQKRVVSKIEELFRKLDAGIEAIRKAKEQLKQYRQSVLKYAFEGKLTERWRTNNKHTTPFTTEAKRDDIISILNRKKIVLPIITETPYQVPKEWALQRIGDVCTHISKGESPRWQGFDYVQNGILFIRSENVLNGHLDISRAVKITTNFHNKLSRSKLQVNDVLLNLVGASIGRCCVVPPQIVEANVNQAVALMRPSAAILPKFLMYLMLSPQLQAIIHGSKVETARPNASLEDLILFPIPLPSGDEQSTIIQEIERLLSIGDEMTIITQKSLEYCKNLRSSILKNAFEGKLTAQDTNDDPADNLLRRIVKRKDTGTKSATKTKHSNVDSRIQTRIN